MIYEEEKVCVQIGKTEERGVVGLKDFDQLVGSQLQTMEKLLCLQSEIERCQQLKEQLSSFPDEIKCKEIESEIDFMKDELHMIQKVFEKQTEEVILSYQAVLPIRK
ncbi:YgaB family protein [Metabacillus dongyingensis]|jgi:YgaB-like protein|uniref:YgaB family protein n=1 Tax=Metabacillus dongyingensis TaxID=2874282 RepID=UPI003B8CEFE9